MSDLSVELARLEQRLRALELSNRLNHHSLEAGSVPVYDEAGVVRQVIGVQPDGTYTTIDLNGPKPVAPSMPLVNGVAGGLVVGWDGATADGSPLPADWYACEVHVSTVSGFTATDATQVHAFPTSKGGQVTIGGLTAGEQHYVVLVMVTTSGTESDQSLEMSGIPQASAGGVTTYFDDIEPAGGNTGDLWINTADGNSLWRYDGTAWIQAQDSAIGDALAAAQNAQDTADGKIVTYAQDTAPTASGSGDLWIDTANGNLLKRWDGAAWTVVQDADIAQALADATAAADAAAAAQADADAAATAAAAAQSAADAAQSTADGKVVTWYQGTEPLAADSTVGDLWINTADANKLFRFDGVDYIAVEDSRISQALSDAATAQSTADGKVVTFTAASTAPPTADGIGDVWLVTDLGNLIRRWDGAAWVDLAVGTDAIANGAVTDTELSDSAVTETKIAANAVTAGKLESNLVLSTRIIAGNAGGSRIEMNSAGLEAYAADGTKTFDVDSATGDVTMTGIYRSNAPTLPRVEIGTIDPADFPNYTTIKGIEFENGDAYASDVTGAIYHGSGTGNQMILQLTSGRQTGFEELARIFIRSSNQVGPFPSQIELDADRVDLGNSETPQEGKINVYGQLRLHKDGDAGVGAVDDCILKIGPETGNHMRIDGNEIVSMADALNQGPLNLNIDGDTNVAAGNGTLRIGQGVGRIAGLNFGTERVAGVSSGNYTINHGLGETPATVVASLNSELGGGAEDWHLSVKNFDANSFTVGINSSTGANVSSEVKVSWIAIA